MSELLTAGAARELFQETGEAFDVDKMLITLMEKIKIQAKYNHSISHQCISNRGSINLLNQRLRDLGYSMHVLYPHPCDSMQCAILNIYWN